MSIISTALSLGKSALGFLTPAGGALKLAPWAIAGVLVVALTVEQYRLIAADAHVKAVQAQAAAQVASDAAAQNAAAVVQVQKAAMATNAAELQLFAQRQAVQTQLGAALARIPAPQGQDGPIPPVLAEMFP